MQYVCVTSTNPSLPGTVGTPAAFIVSRAVALSPMTRILSDCRSFRISKHLLHRESDSAKFQIRFLQCNLSQSIPTVNGCNNSILSTTISSMADEYNIVQFILMKLDWVIFQCSLKALVLLTLGPIKLRPWSLQMSTKVAFSAKNPQPGCNIVHLWLIAADTILGIFRYLLRNTQCIMK